MRRKDKKYSAPTLGRLARVVRRSTKKDIRYTLDKHNEENVGQNPYSRLHYEEVPFTQANFQVYQDILNKRNKLLSSVKHTYEYSAVKQYNNTEKASKQVKAKKPLNPMEASKNLDTLSLIQTVREGVAFPMFEEIAMETSFSMTEWSTFLHLSERTMQRYKKEKSSFEPPQSEKILEIMLLVNKGIEVFGNKQKFDAWLNATNLALGKVKPKDLLDSSFGINLLKDELIRIEYGVFA